MPCDERPDPLRGQVVILAHVLNGFSRVSEETGKELKRIRHRDDGGRRERSCCQTLVCMQCYVFP